jgi:hypothetical protein
VRYDIEDPGDRGAPVRETEEDAGEERAPAAFLSRECDEPGDKRDRQQDDPLERRKRQREEEA